MNKTINIENEKFVILKEDAEHEEILIRLVDGDYYQMPFAIAKGFDPECECSEKMVRFETLEEALAEF